MKSANDWAVELFLRHSVRGEHVREIQLDALLWASRVNVGALSAKISELLIQKQNEHNSTKTPILLGSDSPKVGT